MQQRYYDPIVGAFLSVDPQVVDTLTATDFGRYDYAANNPFKFTDPDGRQVSINYNQPKTPGYRAADRHQNGKGEISASGHGSSDHITDDRNRVGDTQKGRVALDAKGLSSDFQGQPEYSKHSKLVILSCNAGNGENSLAQQVADITGNTTEASTGLVEGNPNNGKMTPFADSNGNHRKDAGEARPRASFTPRTKQPEPNVVEQK